MTQYDEIGKQERGSVLLLFFFLLAGHKLGLSSLDYLFLYVEEMQKVQIRKIEVAAADAYM